VTDPATIEPTSNHYTSSRLRLHYLDWGNDGAPIVLLVHGGRDHARSWDWVAEALRHDYHVICPDLRGHGDSEWSADGAYIAPYHVIDLAELIEHLGGGPVLIVAHSAGAVVSLRYAGLFPDKVRKLAAIEGIGLSSETDPEKLADQFGKFVSGRLAAVRREPRAYATVADAAERMKAENKHLDDAHVLHLTRHGLRQNPDGSFGWKFDKLTRPLYPIDATDETLRALWRRIECPVWLVHGADSWAQHPDAQGRSAEFRDVRVTSFADAGHWVHHDRLDDFVAELKGFLA